MKLMVRRKKRRTDAIVIVIVIATARNVMEIVTVTVTATVIATVIVIVTAIANAKSVAMKRKKVLRWRIARSARSVMAAATGVNVAEIGTGVVVVQRRGTDRKKSLSFGTSSISLQLV